MNSDALSEILKWLRLKAEVYVHADFQGCWAVDTSGSRKVPFHLVNSGRSWLHLEGQEPRLLSAGDLVMFPRDRSHFLSSEQFCPTTALVEATLKHQGQMGDGHITGLACGFFEFESRSVWPLLDQLSDVVVLELSDTSRLGNTRALLQLLIAELEEHKQGYLQSVNHLTHVLFIHILRSQLDGIDSGLLKALFHPRVGKALTQIHTYPDKGWTLERLAQMAGMSRAAFASEFKALTGKTAMTYLAEWRMLQASELLLTTSMATAEIAERCGYGSEVAFRKAFKKVTGQAPGAVRASRVS